MIAYLIPIAVLWIAVAVVVVAIFKAAADADRQAERLLREPRSVADGVDWNELKVASLERHRARRRGVTHV